MLHPPDLSVRRLRPELMDDPALPDADHRAALGGLRRLHAVSASVERLWRPLRELADGASLRVVDWACGGGDVLIALARRARREGLALSAEGRDLSPRAVAWAAESARRAGVGDDLTFRCVDCVEAARDDGETDVAISSLFLHHLPADDVRAVLAAMAASVTRGVVVQDLVRSASGWRWAWLGSRVVPTNRIVRTDALLSVANAFTPGELLGLAREAGLSGARVDVAWPQRMTLVWRAPR